MGEVIEVPGVIDEDLLRAAEVNRAKSAAGIQRLLQPGEITIRDYILSVAEREGWEPSDSTARRHLNRLVRQGVMESGERYDVRIAHSVVAYWFVNEDDND